MRTVYDVIEGCALKFTQKTTDDFLRTLNEAGYVVVPLKPTEAMVAAGFGVHPCQPGQSKVTDCYGAMIKAALKN